LFWGRASDTYGRKPILSIGLFGASLSTLAFGFAKTFKQMLLARCIAGVLYGNGESYARATSRLIVH
jgi:MFS family permease